MYNQNLISYYKSLTTKSRQICRIIKPTRKKKTKQIIDNASKQDVMHSFYVSRNIYIYIFSAIYLFLNL